MPWSSLEAQYIRLELENLEIFWKLPDLRFWPLCARLRISINNEQRTTIPQVLDLWLLLTEWHWDAISRYIYTGLQGGSIMRGWMKDERDMVACCSDGTRPVIFLIQRQDYKVLVGKVAPESKDALTAALSALEEVSEVLLLDNRIEVFLERDVPDQILKETAEAIPGFVVERVD